jgi:hypothetical protein
MRRLMTFTDLKIIDTNSSTPTSRYFPILRISLLSVIILQTSIISSLSPSSLSSDSSEDEDELNCHKKLTKTTQCIIGHSFSSAVSGVCLPRRCRAIFISYLQVRIRIRIRVKVIKQRICFW